MGAIVVLGNRWPDTIPPRQSKSKSMTWRVWIGHENKIKIKIFDMKSTSNSQQSNLPHWTTSTWVVSGASAGKVPPLHGLRRRWLRVPWLAGCRGSRKAGKWRVVLVLRCHHAGGVKITKRSLNGLFLLRWCQGTGVMLDLWVLEFWVTCWLRNVVSARDGMLYAFSRSVAPMDPMVQVYWIRCQTASPWLTPID